MLGIQVIPNVDRIKIEKALVARDFHNLKLKIGSERKEEIPTLSVDLDEPINIQALRKLKAVSYYYENIFNYEDFILYHGIFKFYQQMYGEAVKDFKKAQ